VFTPEAEAKQRKVKQREISMKLHHRRKATGSDDKQYLILDFKISFLMGTGLANFFFYP